MRFARWIGMLFALAVLPSCGSADKGMSVNDSEFQDPGKPKNIQTVAGAHWTAPAANAGRIRLTISRTAAAAGTKALAAFGPKHISFHVEGGESTTRLAELARDIWKAHGPDYTANLKSGEPSCVLFYYKGAGADKILAWDYSSDNPASDCDLNGSECLLDKKTGAKLKKCVFADPTGQQGK